MRGLSLALIAPVALALAACGGGGGGTTTAPTTSAVTTATTTAPPSRAAAIRVSISSPTHRPRVNKPWPVTITVTDARGKPVAGRLTMRVLFNGVVVGKIDDGAVYRFVGTWREKKGNEITWPPEARGQPLVLQVVVTALRVTVRKGWWIEVR